MLKSSHKIAVYMEGHIDSDYGKMGSGVVRYLPNPIVGVIDEKLAGKQFKILCQPIRIFQFLAKFNRSY